MKGIREMKKEEVVRARGKEENRRNVELDVFLPPTASSRRAIFYS